MAGRRVAVELELEVARYNRGASEALTVTRRVSAAIDDLGDEADGTSRDMDQLALNTDLAKRSVDDLGDEARGTTAELLAMGAAADSAGARVRTAAGAAGRAAGRTAGRTAFRGFDFSQTVAEGRGQIVALVIAGLVAASPLIGAMISGAVTGAVGAGGIIGGVAAAAQDERVKREWQRFAASLTMEDFAGDLFVEPTMRAIRTLEDAFDDMNMRGALSLLADDVGILARGIASMGREFMPGFIKSLERAGPFIDALANGLTGTGYALGQFLDDVSSSQGAVMGLESMFRLLNGSVILLGKGLEILSDIYGAVIKAQAAYSGMMEDIPRWLLPINNNFGAFNDVMEQMIDNADGSRDVGEAIFLGAQAMTKQSTAAGELFRQLQNLNQATDDYLENSGAMAESSDNFEASLLDLKDALKENGDTIDDHTRAGLSNRDAFRQAIEDAKEDRRVTIERTGAVVAANLVYAEQIKRVEDLATAAGITKEQLQGLAGVYDINVVLNLNAILGNTLQLLLGSLGTGGIGAVFNTMKLLNSIGPRPPSPAQTAPAQRISDLARGGGRASGGYMRPGHWYDVGEEGPERAYMGFDGTAVVQPFAGGGGSGPSSYGGGMTVIENHIHIGDEVVKVVRTEISESNRNTNRRVHAGSGAR